MDEQARAALHRAAIYTDGHRYCMVHLPPDTIAQAAALMAEASEAFSGVLADKDEVTLILREARWQVAAAHFPVHEAHSGYHLLTFDLPLDHDLIGFLSVISARLAAAGVAIMALSAYERDHLLIHEQYLATALSVIAALKQEAAD